jgi:endonuclease/exonuclease/phosphatase family metal-dependent hydrolase
MKIMTFNLRGALYDDGANRWPQRAALNVRTIQRYAPDLIGLQEAHQENLDYYHQHLPGYTLELGYPYNNRQPYQHTSIAYRPERLRLLEAGGFWLSETPDVLSGSWGTSHFRSATWIVFEWLPTGLKFLHVNTHLDHISALARSEGAKLIAKKTSQVFKTCEVSKAILTGDFNCTPVSDAYRVFQAAGFVDTYPADAPDFPTFHNFQGPAYQPGQPHETDRMDWILLRGWETTANPISCRVITDAEPPLYPSDHYPVLADIRIT